MGADLSRVRFDPRSDHAGVVLQQGRLLLDADWNELVDLLDRRLRAEAADLDSPGPATGASHVAVVPRTTPDAFKVTLTAGALTIGRGRMYVDGLVAENHGTGPLQFDPLLAESRGTQDTAYADQPYWPTAPALPTGGSFLAYLDVWRRELTHVEDPDLVDPAIAVDTTARTQTVWQVRLHALDNASVSCSTPDADVPGWPALTAPSGGRLTVDTIPVNATDDPCQLPPSGGYRGLENQTYRVQVVEGGQPGTARFVWSRDNASVVSPVVEVLPGFAGIRPASLGRDDVLRFKDDDWVEIIDDHRELDGASGELRRIQVDEGAGTLTFSPGLPPDLRLTAAQAADRHLRVRRWDQRGQVKSAAGGNLDNLDALNAKGSILVPAAATTGVVLEAGIVVRFSSTGAPLRPGDHWIFAARTADTSVEKLDQAPPLGIHHHYARLGVLSFPSGETDCRVPWPPECTCEGEGGCGDCTVCVTPESHASGALTIQDAVDQVREAGGGTVCLEPGLYRLDSTVEIAGTSSITVRGQGLRTVVVARESAFRVSRSAYIRLQDLTVVSPGVPPAVVLETTADVRVERLTILTVGNTDLPGTGVGLSGVSLLTCLRDNVVVAGAGITGGDGERALLTAGLDISDNLLVCRDVGVALGGRVGHLLSNAVTANTILRARLAGVRMLGAIAPGHGCEVDENTLGVGGRGIEVATSGFTVDDNDVTGGPESIERRSDGITVLPATFGATLRGATRLSGNRVHDVGGRGIAVLAPVTGLEITHNLVERAQQGIVMDERARALSAVVSHNTVVEVGARDRDQDRTLSGIQVAAAFRASVESNVVLGVGSAEGAADESVGIRVIACPESRIAANSVDAIGVRQGGRSDLGVGVQGLVARTQVAGNQVRRQPVEVDDDAQSGFRGLLIGGISVGAAAAAPVGAYVVGDGEVPFVVGTHLARTGEPRTAVVTVDTNIVGGSGEVATAQIGLAAEVVVTGNQFHARRDFGAPALDVRAVAATVSANRLRGGEPSGSLDVDPKRLAVLGNLTTTGIQVSGGPLEPRWDPLNQNGF